MNTRPLNSLPLFDIVPHLQRIQISPQTQAICRDSLRPLKKGEDKFLPPVITLEPAYVQRVLRRMQQTRTPPVVRAEQIKLESGQLPYHLYRTTPFT